MDDTGAKLAAAIARAERAEARALHAEAINAALGVALFKLLERLNVAIAECDQALADIETQNRKRADG